MIQEDRAQAQYRKMTETPIPKLVLTLGIPTTISMLVTNIYNMADTFFVGTLGTSASGATGVVFGLMGIIQAFGFMLGHGAGSNISRRLGSREVDKARMYAATSFYASLGAGLLILLFGFCFQDPLLRLLGSTDSILPYARDYSTWILLAAPAMAGSCVMNNILRYEGKATFAMCGLVSGGLLNILGDYLLIQVFSLGISGAGISTAVSQYISAGILLVPFVTKKVQSRVTPRFVSHRFGDLLTILITGLPSMMRQGLGSISTMVLNGCAGPYGDAAIAAMSIVSRVMNFLFCIGLGVGQGFQPVSAFNYGAKKYSRTKDAALFTCFFSMVVLAVAAAFGWVFAGPIVTLFREDPDVIAIGTFALQAHCIALCFLPISVCGNMLFQSIGKSGRATFLASSRSGLFFIPIVLLLNWCMGLTGLQIAQAVADILSALVTLPLVWSFLRHLPPDGAEAA
ncbi:MAG: MATE family efflux transporter [Clostridia bacterium]|nr:MATE family efflux transporter [Clostridia bacterium]MDD7483766.1 MATE family efflux transporter [Clostridia bacterium]MDY5559106.1 MATE family efflux transporter [Candidatus Heritagella sp.]